MDGQTLGIVGGIVSALASAVAVLFKLQTKAVEAQLKTVTEVKDAYKLRIDFLESRLDKEVQKNTDAANARASDAVQSNDKVHDALRAAGAIAEALNRQAREKTPS